MIGGLTDEEVADAMKHLRPYSQKRAADRSGVVTGQAPTRATELTKGTRQLRNAPIRMGLKSEFVAIGSFRFGLPTTSSTPMSILSTATYADVVTIQKFDRDESPPGPRNLFH
jgi:hypothetical protein